MSTSFIIASHIEPIFTQVAPCRCPDNTRPRATSPAVTISLLETVRPMPSKIARVGPMRRVAGPGRSPRPVDQAPHAFNVVDLPRHQHVQLIRQADEPTVEHPVDGA